MKSKFLRISIYLIFILIGMLSNQTTAAAINNIVASPINDNIANAEVLTSPPTLSVSYSTTEATSQAAIDPVPINGGECDIDASAATVWYQYAPSSATAISIDTSTSDYDTFIAIWLGPTSGVTNASQLTFVNCNDDADISTLTSNLTIQLDAVAADTTYYIEIGQFVPSATSSLEIKKK